MSWASVILGALLLLALPGEVLGASGIVPDRPDGVTAAAMPSPRVECLRTPSDLSGRDARLVAAYGFDRSSGGEVADVSGERHPAKLVEAALTEGRWGSGVALNGTTGYLRIDQPGWPTRDYTFAVWVRPRAVREWQTILEIQTPSGRGVELAIAPGGRLEVWSSGWRRLRHGAGLAPGTWTHVAVTRAGGLVTLLVNGVPERAGRDRTVFDFGRCPALVGVDADGGCADRLNGFFGGVLDELRVYDCAVPAEGIRSIMNTAMDPALPTPDRSPAPPGQLEPTGRGGARMPAGFDLWIAAELAALLDRSPSFDLFVAQGVGYGLLGGVAYATLMFVFWMQGAQPGQQHLRRRTVTLAVGSIVAALLTLAEARAVSWPPPSAHPGLAGSYPAAFPANLNQNAFPSQSTALYAAIASGTYAISRGLGVWAWIGVGVLVALPRMYLGGHYLSDIFGGLVAGVGGYWLAVLVFGSRAGLWFGAVFERGLSDWRRTLAECAVFLWMLQVATEFSLVAWITNAFMRLWK